MFTKFEKDVSVHQGLADEPNIDNGMSAEDLKKLWDKPAEDLKQAFNNLIDEMIKNSASTNIGAGKMGTNDESENNINAKLIYLYESIANVALGQIPDNTITKAKMNPEYEETLAKKDGGLQIGLNAEMVNGNSIENIGVRNGELQTGLNSEFVGGKNIDEILSHKNYVLGTYTATGDGNISVSKTINLGFTPSAVIIFSRGTYFLAGEMHVFVTFKNFTSTDLTIVENGFKVTGAANDTDYRYGYIALI